MIQQVGGILTPEQCQELIDYARPLLSPSKVQFGNVRRISELRRSDNARIREPHPVADLLRTKASILADTDVEKAEDIDVVRYGPGGYFRMHHDGDHRSHTLCVTLSDKYTGGELMFLGREITYHEPTGYGVLWENSRNMLHSCGLVVDGEKWIAVVWLLGG